MRGPEIVLLAQGCLQYLEKAVSIQMKYIFNIHSAQFL